MIEFKRNIPAESGRPAWLDAVLAERERNPVDFELTDFWYWLQERDRRVLCVMACVDVSNAGRRWDQIETEKRVAIIRGMHELAQLALESAQALTAARENLEKHSRAR